MDWNLFTQNPFVRLGTEHIIWLILGMLYGYFWIKLGKDKDEKTQKKFALTFSFIGFVAWLLMTFIHLISGGNYQDALPFHICYFLFFLLIYMHYKRSFVLFEWWYCWVMAGSSQALLTPHLDFGFPHYFDIRYFFVHITLVLHIIYATRVYKFRPRFSAVWKSLIAGNLYFLFCMGINKIFDTNFMYTEDKPPGTILDLLGDHYFLKIQPLAFLAFLIVWLPFYRYGHSKPKME
jgi:hypothetical integral membrane protein (TIGR02206 family)